MNEASNKRAVAVGLFIIIGLLFLVVMVLTIGNLHSSFSKKMTVSTVFSDVNGLVAGNNIWFSGVKIGTVKKIEFSGTSDVKVLMNINLESKQYIRSDAKVKISTDGLIGNKILVVYGGTAKAPAIEEGDKLASGVMLSTEDIMNTFQQSNLNILAITKRLSDGEGTIGKFLSSDAVYNSIAVTANSLQKASAQTQLMMASLSEFTTKLNESGTLANDLVTDTTVFDNISASVEQLQRVSDTAAVFINNLKDMSENPKSPAGVLMLDEQAGSDLKATIRTLEISSQKLNEDLEAIQHNFLFRRYFKKEAKKNQK